MPADTILRESLDHWAYVTAGYSVVIIGTLALVAWSWLSMKAAERRRDESRRK